MDTTDTVLLIILTTFMSIFFLLGIVVLIFVLKLVKSLRRVVEKAGEVVASVESASEVIKDARGPLAAFKLVKNIYKVVNRSRK
jgi:hypothetical protein